MKNNPLKNHPENRNFQHEMLVDATIEKVFSGIAKEIPLWWTEMFEGSSDTTDSLFTVRFGPSVFKTMLVQELNVNKKIVWLVTDTLIDVPQLNNKQEWLNTEIVWELTQEGGKTLVSLTHLGLNPDIECYDICSVGWRNFCASLKSYLEKGIGMPFKPVGSNA